MKTFHIGNRKVGKDYPPLVIAEIGINHEGDMNKAITMVDDAHKVGCECVKFQSHILNDEMIPNDIIPGNTSESIWEIISRCALSEKEEIQLKAYVESKKMIYLSTPFSRAAAQRLKRIGLVAYKIGSGECNNYPLIKHIASYGKPILLSTGMNDIASIKPSIAILRQTGRPFALLHCTSIYPTPHEKVRLGALTDLAKNFPDALLGLSDHSLGNFTCFGAIPLGARILEKHFTSDKNWPGPDIPISIDPLELGQLVEGAQAIFKALGGRKNILIDEAPTIAFAYACVVSIRDIKKGDKLSFDNVWVKRPGSGEIKAVYFEKILGYSAKKDISKNMQIKWSDITETACPNEEKTV